jgi:hypothetical protein
MKIPKEYQKDFEAFPQVLRKLLDAELAAGNAIAEIGHGFPAPPAGAYIKLKKALRSRPRASGGGIDFYDRNGSNYSGEITDAKRFFFLLEPPHPPQPEPDMDAIRAEREARQRAADEKLFKVQIRSNKRLKKTGVMPKFSTADPEWPAVPSGPSKPLTTLDRFRESTVINYERWHDGTGYDLSLLKEATPQELVEIEQFLVSRGANDWRDVEALAALDSPRARLLLLKTLKGSNRELAVAVTDYAPSLVSEDERVVTLVAALEDTEFYGGLTQALLQVEKFHPPKIIEALFRGVLARDGGTAVHFAAMLMFLHGKAESSFDWSQRPFFLEFNTEDRAEREAAFRKLCSKVGVEANDYVAAPGEKSAKARNRKKE